MKLASLKSDGKDGILIVVSKDLTLATLATDIAPTMLAALENWNEVQNKLDNLYNALNFGEVSSSFQFDPTKCSAPLPRTFQFLDGSAFLSHSALMQKAFNLDPISGIDITPLMYQGASDDFFSGFAPINIVSEDQEIDFEGEIAVIVDDTPQNCESSEALDHIKLILLLNDVSLRAFAPREMSTGFGFIHAKPSTSFAPIAVTPDELGHSWLNGRVNLPLNVSWNNQWFGNPNAKEMHFGFHDLIAHATKTRRLSAGTIIGSGTISNSDRSAGSACISERRAIEMIETGTAKTHFLSDGDRVQMDMYDESGQSIFGGIDQVVAIQKQEN